MSVDFLEKAWRGTRKPSNPNVGKLMEHAAVKRQFPREVHPLTPIGNWPWGEDIIKIRGVPHAALRRVRGLSEGEYWIRANAAEAFAICEPNAGHDQASSEPRS